MESYGGVGPDCSTGPSDYKKLLEVTKSLNEARKLLKRASNVLNSNSLTKKLIDKFLK